MAGRIRDEDIAAVRDKTRIDEIIGEHVQLRSAGGGNLKGICPFHDEKSPSLSVSPSRGLYHCFGCGAGGDVIKFLQELEHLSFSEAVEQLAARVNVQLRYVDGVGPGRPSGQRARLVEAHTLAAAFYADQLRTPEALPAREFLSQRGFDSDTAVRFGCGYAPGGWDSLTKYLLGRGFLPAELTLAGLSRESGRGSLIDRFHRRLLWPIKDVGGDVVGFGARRIHDDDKIDAKYLNTPETPIYKKSQLLYGMDVAKREIAKQHTAVIVEGYTDVMACHLAGVTTAVATCGTAFGSEHIGVIRRSLMDSDTFRGKVIFTFDGDAAGMKAAERAFADEQKFIAQTFVAIEATGKDPCELRQAGGDPAVRSLVDNAIPLVEFVLRTTVNRFDLETVEGRSAALDAGIPMIAAIKDRSRHEGFAVKLAGLVGVEDPNRIVARVRGYERSTERGKSAQQPQFAGGQSVGGASNDRQRGQYSDQRRDERGQQDQRRDQRGHYSDQRRDQGRDQQRDERDSGRDQRRDGGEQRQSPAAAPQGSAVPARLLALEREVIKCALQLPGTVGKDFDELGSAAFLGAVHQQLSEAIKRCGGASQAKSGPAWPQAVAEQLPDGSEARAAVNALAVEPLHERVDRQERYAAAVVTSLAEKVLSREIAAMHSRMQRLTAIEDHAGAGEIARQLTQLQSRHRELRALAIGGE